MQATKKRLCVLLCAALLLLPVACQKEPWQDLRLFCENYSALTDDKSALVPEHFSLEQAADGSQRWQAAPDALHLLTLEALPGGRLHTVSLTTHAEEGMGAFLAEAKRLLGAFTQAPPDQCARWLYALGAGEDEPLGFVQLEEGGFRFAYAANAAGRYLRISNLTFLPPESEPPTLRDWIIPSNTGDA